MPGPQTPEASQALCLSPEHTRRSLLLFQPQQKDKVLSVYLWLDSSLWAKALSTAPTGRCSTVSRPQITGGLQPGSANLQLCDRQVLLLSVPSVVKEGYKYPPFLLLWELPGIMGKAPGTASGMWRGAQLTAGAHKGLWVWGVDGSQYTGGLMARLCGYGLGGYGLPKNLAPSPWVPPQDQEN